MWSRDQMGCYFLRRLKLKLPELNSTVFRNLDPNLIDIPLNPDWAVFLYISEAK